MIQRKQTLFLLLAVCAMAMMFMFPLATFSGTNDRNVEVKAELNLIAKDSPQLMEEIRNGETVHMNQKEYIKVWPLVALTLASGLLALVSIFLYKKRVTQMRVVSVAFLLELVNIFLIFIWAVDVYIKKVSVPMACTDTKTTYGVGIWCAIIGLVMLFLAQRAIKKDEEKVRAADRLRN